jgi:hypothetical protein
MQIQWITLPKIQCTLPKIQRIDKGDNTNKLNVYIELEYKIVKINNI